MPLPSVRMHGARLCGCKSKRTRLPCNNPAAFGTRACRMHGAHKSRNVPQGANHPQYRNAGQTRRERHERSEKSVQFALLEQLGWYLNMFTGTKTRGRKPSGYRTMDLSDPDELSEIVLKTLPKAKSKI
jgi:hypothetical protein